MKGSIPTFHLSPGGNKHSQRYGTSGWASRSFNEKIIFDTINQTKTT
jgi:hypothetical protein